MVRKLQQFIDDEKRREADDRDLVSRSELRREQQRIEGEWLTIAQRLIALKPRQLEALELTEQQLDVVDELRVIESAPARQRALKQLRALLRGHDLADFNRRLESLSDPMRQQRVAEPATEWCNRLTQGTTTEIAAVLEGFVAKYPQVDRSQLRMLVRNHVRAKESERTRSRNKLTRFVTAAMATAGAAAVAIPARPESE